MSAVLFLEVIHYRNAVLESNADRKRAWQTVVELRAENLKCVNAGLAAQPQGDSAH